MKPNVVFYQQHPLPYFGILILAAHLKQSGYKAEVIIESLENDPIGTLKGTNTPIIGISVLSTEHSWLIETTKAIRRAMPDVKIIVGGIHAIFYAEEIFSDASVDFVCHSEGEAVLLSVINELNKGVPDWGLIPGLCYKDSKGTVHINERAPLVSFRDDIIEDRDIYYDRYPQLAEDVVHRFFSSRGCPFRCSFCYNSKIQDIFKGKGVYVRKKSVDNLITEISSQCAKYRMKTIFFYDDLFTFDEKWLEEFLEIYKVKINIPFMCTARADLINENVAHMLGSAGCRTVSFGIETGNYEIRKKILKKDITDEQIIRCARLLHNNKINIQTSNMFCLPDEAVDDAYKTVEINIRTKTDFAFSALFMPFPKTEIADYCMKRGLLSADYSLKDLPRSFLTASVLSVRNKTALINIHYLLYFFVRWPFFYKVCKRLCSCPFSNIFFKPVFMLSNLLRYKAERGIPLRLAIGYALRMEKTL